ncbi:tryptophan halogenase [Pelomonas saccharophila]|uniref:Tryptophan halogenase n=1 Tax=Roseateles saccharophilus TaxID=304 RepID=A0ABU1YM76_ROSSA|nr:tryptophan 7-halogenase [Roseateles saccharophilus]MDR7269955.1 tryptophan halogenase [Roseateles saccharophilus]
MPASLVRRIVIVGGGTAGWMAAAAFSRLLGPGYDIRLVESDEIGTIGVGEASIPYLADFNAALGLDENEFLRATQGTFKLGIEFVDWARLGDRYTHAFGQVAMDIGALAFHHYWLRLRMNGDCRPLGVFSLNALAASQGRFMRARPDLPNSPLGNIAHAFHFDAGLYARFLRGFAEQRGVRRVEGKVVEVRQGEDGGIAGVQLENGDVVEGDFFLDCSGLRGLLIEQTLKAGYHDWRHWLPCDRAVAVPCASVQPLLPYTRATARPAGWQWRIPLQHRIGNGHVFSSRFMSEDEATALLMSKLDGEPLAEPRCIPFVPGQRKRFWIKNCVALGLAAGFFEPIESTNIHLIQTAIMRVLALLPRAGMDAEDIDEYNAQTQAEYERIRDFVILHYHATERDDSPFWTQCRTMAVPDTLRRKMALFRSNGRLFHDGKELFADSSWLQVLIGQRIDPRGYHPLADGMALDQVQGMADSIEQLMRRCVESMPTHEAFIKAECSALRP